MTGQGLLQLALYVVVLVLLVKPLGAYMAAVFQGEPTFMSPLLGPVERLIYRVSGVDPAHESGWTRYAFDALLVNLLGFIAVYALQRSGVCPSTRRVALHPTSFNTAVSFATNTNWRGYVGEATMS
jgi:K+-transporting ATPase ATPase A chain